MVIVGGGGGGGGVITLTSCNNNCSLSLFTNCFDVNPRTRFPLHKFCVFLLICLVFIYHNEVFYHYVSYLGRPIIMLCTLDTRVKSISLDFTYVATFVTVGML